MAGNRPGRSREDRPREHYHDPTAGFAGAPWACTNAWWCRRATGFGRAARPLRLPGLVTGEGAARRGERREATVVEPAVERIRGGTVCHDDVLPR